MYHMKKKRTLIIIMVALLLTGLPAGILGTKAYGATEFFRVFSQTDEGGQISGYRLFPEEDENKTSVVYCYNHDLSQPPVYGSQRPYPYYTKEGYLNNSADYLHTEGGKNRIAAVLFAGYDVDGCGFQSKYKVSPEKAEKDTQEAVWALQKGDTFDYLQPENYGDALLHYADTSGYFGSDVAMTVEGDLQLVQRDGQWTTAPLKIASTYGGLIQFPALPAGYQAVDTEGDPITGIHANESFSIRYTGSGTPSSETILNLTYKTGDVEFYKQILPETYAGERGETSSVLRPESQQIYQDFIRMNVSHKQLQMKITAEPTQPETPAEDVSPSEPTPKAPIKTLDPQDPAATTTTDTPKEGTVHPVHTPKTGDHSETTALACLLFALACVTMIKLSLGQVKSKH